MTWKRACIGSWIVFALGIFLFGGSVCQYEKIEGTRTYGESGETEPAYAHIQTCAPMWQYLIYGL